MRTIRQIHLSTLIVVTLAAGVILAFNIIPEITFDSMHGATQFHYGWPLNISTLSRFPDWYDHPDQRGVKHIDSSPNMITAWPNSLMQWSNDTPWTIVKNWAPQVIGWVLALVLIGIGFELLVRGSSRPLWKLHASTLILALLMGGVLAYGASHFEDRWEGFMPMLADDDFGWPVNTATRSVYFEFTHDAVQVPLYRRPVQEFGPLKLRWRGIVLYGVVFLAFVGMAELLARRWRNFRQPALSASKIA